MSYLKKKKKRICKIEESAGNDSIESIIFFYRKL